MVEAQWVARPPIGPSRPPIRLSIECSARRPLTPSCWQCAAAPYHAWVPVPDDETWLALTAEKLSAGSVHDWAVRDHCGAVVLFSGTVRDHAEGRTGVTELEYESYEEEVVPKLDKIAAKIGRASCRERV